MVDIVLCVFSTSQLSPAETWAKEYFKEPPIVINVPGDGGASFRANIIRWAKTGDLFRAALKDAIAKGLKIDPNIEIRNRMFVSFSVGWSAMDELVKFPKELERLNSYLLLDGCHTPNLDLWKKLALRAASYNGLFMAMANSSIKPPFVASSVTNLSMFNYCKDELKYCTNVPLYNYEIPDLVTTKKLEKPVLVQLGAAGSPGTKTYIPSIKKTWTEDPLISAESIGNLINLHYAGTDRPDHVYIARETQKRLWKMMGNYFNLD